MIDGAMLTTVLAYLAASGAVVLVAFLWTGESRLAGARVRDLVAADDGPPPKRGAGRPSAWKGLALRALPAVGAPLRPGSEEQRTRLQARFQQAGLYGRHVLPVYLGAKMVLLTVPVVAALVVGLAGLVPAAHAWLGGALASATALLLPGLWLGGRIRARRKALLKGLPDALDALVLCVEGGLSLRAAVQRITAELQTAHPALATEMTIVQREIELGQSAGEAMRSFARRAKLTEVQTLAAVLLQAEEYGSGIARTLRVHADVYRQQRQQRAEEQAQKAAVKILFPTLLCIFPAIFIVILGPALVQIQEMFAAR